ncbi:MAG: CDP-alcohol phosphatidyltransferase family protein [Nakamurella sp.]
MFDAALRRTIAPAVDSVAGVLVRLRISPTALTVSGFVAGAGSCWAVAGRHWMLALVLWLLNRALDGLDGPVARAGHRASALGGFLDVVADFAVYAGFVIAVAIAIPDARLACAVLVGTYYLSGTAFLTLSSLIERYGPTGEDRLTGSTYADERSLRFVGGLAEGAETILVYVLFCLFPGAATTIAWVFAGMVLVTALQRIVVGVRLLRGLHDLPDEESGRR